MSRPAEPRQVATVVAFVLLAAALAAIHDSWFMDIIGGRLSPYGIERMSEKRFGQLIEAARRGFADGTMAGL